MFSLATLGTIAVKLLLQLVIVVLQKSGLEGKIVASGLKAGEHVQAALQNIKVYNKPDDEQYPTGKNGAGTAAGGYNG